MNANNTFRRMSVATLGMAAGFLAIRGAIADDLPTTSVIATRSAEPTVTVVGRSYYGVPIVVAQIQHSVRFEDLDLSTQAGATALRKRVSDVARRGCRQVDRLFPRTSPDHECITDAVSEAMPQIDSAISEARAQTSTRS